MAWNDSEILSEDELQAKYGNLFGEDAEEDNGKASEETDGNNEKNNETNVTEDIDPENLFDEVSNPESVGNEDNNNGDTDKEPSSKKSVSSPNNYALFAKTFKEEGLLSDIDDEDINKVDSVLGLLDLVKKQVETMQDEQSKRVTKALNNEVPQDTIKAYENTLNQLNNITEDILKEESELAENMRKQLIYRDYLDRGFSLERASKMVLKSINDGTDIEDAKEALESIKTNVLAQYDSILKQAEDTKKAEIAETNKLAESLKKSILEDKAFFTDIQIDKTTRQRVIENITKPVYKDEQGNSYTALQKYERENRAEFLKNVGILFTLTNGFKDIEGLVKNKVKKEVKKHVNELENVINNTQRSTDGSLSFMGDSSDKAMLNFRLDI